MGFCPSGLLSQWAFVLVGFCPVGFCPSGLLSYALSGWEGGGGANVLPLFFRGGKYPPLCICWGDNYPPLSIAWGQMSTHAIFYRGADVRGGKMSGSRASLYTGSSVWDGLVVVWGVSVDITHSSFRACMHCMYWYSILQGTRAWRYNYRDGWKLWHHSFIEHDRFDFFTSERRIRAVMYIPCVKCACSELKLAKHLHTFFVLT